jgi:DNA-binding GntR family transcriptional regulator
MADAFATKSDLAYSQIRRLILSGDLAPGAPINQEVLAHSLGISTTPLREAMRRLKSEGLVQLDAHRDARVSSLNLEEARDLFELRRSLDPLAASLAAERRTHEDLTALRGALLHLKPLPGDPAVSELIAHRRFHSALYRAAHNDLLIATLDGLWDKADRYRRLALNTPRTTQSLEQKSEEHNLLVEHIAARDSEAAAEVMRSHIDTSLAVEAIRQLNPTPTAAG